MAKATSKSEFKVGDAVILRGTVTRVHEDQGTITVSVEGYSYPLTVMEEYAQRLPGTGPKRGG